MKTRIETISETVDGINENKYICQHLIVFVPILLWEWWPMHISIEQEAVFDDINEAKRFIDNWIEMQKDYRKEDEEKARIKIQRKNSRSLTYMDYP